MSFWIFELVSKYKFTESRKQVIVVSNEFYGDEAIGPVPDLIEQALGLVRAISHWVLKIGTRCVCCSFGCRCIKPSTKIVKLPERFENNRTLRKGSSFVELPNELFSHALSIWFIFRQTRRVWLVYIGCGRPLVSHKSRVSRSVRSFLKNNLFRIRKTIRNPTRQLTICISTTNKSLKIVATSPKLQFSRDFPLISTISSPIFNPVKHFSILFFDPDKKTKSHGVKEFYRRTYFETDIRLEAFKRMRNPNGSLKRCLFICTCRYWSLRLDRRTIKSIWSAACKILMASWIVTISKSILLTRIIWSLIWRPA